MHPTLGVTSSVPIKCVQGQQPICTFDILQGDTSTTTILVIDAGEVWLAASSVQADTWPKSLRKFLTVVDGVNFILVIII